MVLTFQFRVRLLAKADCALILVQDEETLMRKLVGPLAAIMLTTPFLTAQNVSVTQSESRQGVPDSRPAPKQKLTPEQRERAMQLLEGAEAGASALDPASRAYALIQISRAYRLVDKKKAVELLEEAMTSAKVVGQDDERFKRLGGQLQEQAVRAMVQLAPEKADELLPQLDPRSREQVFNALLDYYERENKMDHAMDLLYRWGQDGEFPYGSAIKVMEKLTPEQQDQKQQLFTVALGSFQDHDPVGMYFGGGDFPAMIERFHNDLPGSLVHQAIDVVLEKARKTAEKDSKDSSPTISIASDKGAVQFNSIYTYRLFQLLPILKQIDPQEAEKLEKEQNDVQTLLAKYPQGMGSISEPKAGTDGMSFSVSSGDRGKGGGGPDGARLLDMQREAKIVKDAETHPQDALANAATLQAPNLRTNAYVTIARMTWKKNSSVARQALQKAVESLDKMDLEAQSMSTSEIAKLYLLWKDEDSAKKVIEKGIASTEKMYKNDINADDPNKAPKAYWPSTVAWRSMLSLASQVSPLWAATLLKEIPDDEIKTLAQLGIASALLDAQSPQTEIMSYTKEGGRMMIMNNEEKPRP